MKYLIIVSKKLLNVFYSLLKFRKMDNKKILLLSRQSNEISIDYKLLIKTFEKKGYYVKNINYKLEQGFIKKILYVVHIFVVTVELSNTKVCIVDGYSIPVSVLKHRKDLVVLQLWHALGAVKKFGYQTLDQPDGRSKKISTLMDMHKNYTYLACSSEATKEIYHKAFNINKSKIKIIGMPRVDYLNNIKKSLNKDIYKDYPNLKKKKTILYVPTFRKNKTIDIDSILSKVDEKKYNFIISKHPLDKTIIPNKNSISDKYNSYELLAVADYIITDYSAIGIEASLLDKPIYFYLYDYDTYTKKLGVNIDLFTEMKNATFKDFDVIIKKIEKDEFDYKELFNFRNKYVETLNFNNTEAIIDLVTKE